VGMITVKDTKSRWGSCSHSGNLAYSWRLVLAPQSVAEYVCAHEVAHLMEMNHSPKFWKLVGTLCPDYANQRRWLKVNGKSLFIYG
jgi:predicted metal-dependent hydrolase